MLPAIIMGGASILSGMMTNQANANATHSANQANIEATRLANEQSGKNTAMTNEMNRRIAMEQQQFQERMSNSAYQRSMADMRKAGLNPMLAYSQGGASSPSGSAIQMQNPDVRAPNIQAAHYDDVMSPAISGAVAAHQKGQTIEQAAQGLGIQAAQQKVNEANSTADIALKGAQAAQTAASAKKASIESEILNARAKKERLEGDFYGSDTGKTLFNINKVNEAVGGSLDSLNSAKQLLNPMSILKDLKILKEHKGIRKGQGINKQGEKFDLGTGEIIP